MTTTAQRIKIVAEAAPEVIALAAAAGAPVFGIGAPIAGAAAAIATALTTAGLYIAGAEQDQFSLTIPEATALYVLALADPWALFMGIDNVGGTKPDQAARLMRYLLVASGRTPNGVKGNTGVLHNPRAGDVSQLTHGVGFSKDCPSNPYLCNADPDEDLTNDAVVARFAADWNAWKKAGSKPAAVVPALLASPDYPSPATAAALLELIRGAPGPFQRIMTWKFAAANRAQIVEAVRAARVRAGETGPDTDPVLESIFGGDLTVPAAPPVAVPAARGPAVPTAPAVAPASQSPAPADDAQASTALQPMAAGGPDLVKTTDGTTAAGVLEQRGIRAGLLTTDDGTIYRPLGWWSGLWTLVLSGPHRLSKEFAQ